MGLPAKHGGGEQDRRRAAGQVRATADDLMQGASGQAAIGQMFVNGA